MGGMKPIRVAINGFGRIGRAFFNLALESRDVEIVAINDLGEPENLAYLLKYDTVYGRAPYPVSVEDGALKIDGVHIPLLSEPDPAKLPWKDMQVDVVVESTGVFADYAKAQAHRDAGAKRVVITAPVKGEPPAGLRAATVLMGINTDKLKTCDISSNASCTTNAGSPLIAILDEALGIESALLNTVHGYTASQALIDGSSKKDPRRGRAAAANIIPSTTGAATATTKAYESLAGKFDGVAIRVPVLIGSLVDVTFVAKRETNAEEVNDMLRKAAAEPRWAGIFSVTDEPIVSSDIIGDTHASIADLPMTRVVGGNLIKVMAWYDNEMGYANTLLLHVIETGRYAHA
jgi:glyceraldehyde 3-phosphate dehydrogenase